MAHQWLASANREVADKVFHLSTNVLYNSLRYKWDIKTWKKIGIWEHTGS